MNAILRQLEQDADQELTLAEAELLGLQKPLLTLARHGQRAYTAFAAYAQSLERAGHTDSRVSFTELSRHGLGAQGTTVASYVTVKPRGTDDNILTFYANHADPDLSFELRVGHAIEWGISHALQNQVTVVETKLPGADRYAGLVVMEAYAQTFPVKYGQNGQRTINFSSESNNYANAISYIMQTEIAIVDASQRLGAALDFS